MKIISWNVNGIRACVKKGFFDFVRAQRANVVCLQEAKAFRDQCGDFLAEMEPYHQIWHSAKRPGYSGVLNLHQKPPAAEVLGMGVSKFDDEGRVIITDLGDFKLLNMYFPNGGSGEERHLFKMDFLERILEFFKNLEREKPLVLTGDFNIAHTNVDIHDPVRLDGESGFKPEEREWMDRLVAAGFVDTFRLKYPEARDRYSWWSYRQGARRRNKGWRIDYFFVSKSLSSRVLDIQMADQVEGSDHCPLILSMR